MHYLIIVEGDTEPRLVGPFFFQASVDQMAREHRAFDAFKADSLYWLVVRDIKDVSVGPFAAGFLEEQDE